MRGQAAALLLLACTGHARDAEWERVGERDGIAIERRVAQSSLHELRLTARSPVPPGAVMATLWRHEQYAEFLPYLKRLDVLRDDGDAKLIYEQIHVPFVKDRDLTVRVTRTFSPDAGTYEVVSQATPDEGPPETHDYVRVRTSLARWGLAPEPDGGTAVTFTIGTDAGGRVRAWIVDRVQKDAALKILRAMLDRVRRNNRDRLVDRRADPPTPAR